MTIGLRAGDVVQIEMPRTRWHGCFMLVTDPLAWGAHGVILIPQDKGVPAIASFLWTKHEEMHYIGRAALVPPPSGGEK